MNATLEQTGDIEQLIHEAEQLIDRRNTNALPFAERVMELAIESRNPKHLAQAKYILAFYNCLVANNYDLAIELCNEVLATADFDELGDINYKVYMTLGNSYQLKGDVFSAQESYMAGLKHLEARNGGELDSREKGFLASFYYNVSLLLTNSELNIGVEDYLQKAIDLYTETQGYFKLSKSYVLYAGILEKRKEFDKAITLLFKALEIDKETNDEYSITLTTANLGILHLRIGKYDEALGYLLNTMQYYGSNNMLYEFGMVKTAVSETLFGLGQKDEAIKHLLEAEEVFNQLDNKGELSNVYHLLAQFKEQNNEAAEALKYQKLYTNSLKYFFDIEKTNSLTRAKKEFENEQKEKEASLLKEKNEEIQRYVHRLEISNNELKQFAHVASHDLREPLRMITSYMGLMRKSLNGQITEQQSEFIGYAIDGAKRMELLIVDLLRLAKVDANPRYERVKMQNVVEEIRLNLDVLLKEKHASILFANLPEMHADRTQMLQLFQNIIGNGIKYNESERPVVKVKCINRPTEVEFVITDNGIGIPEAYREKVFQIFQRIDTEQKYSGSGIGLTISKKIVDSMDGRIFIEGNPGGGSTFHIIFPSKVLC
jgi:signal transduction histidine kinase